MGILQVFYRESIQCWEKVAFKLLKLYYDSTGWLQETGGGYSFQSTSRIVIDVPQFSYAAVKNTCPDQGKKASRTSSFAQKVFFLPKSTSILHTGESDMRFPQLRALYRKVRGVWKCRLWWRKPLCSGRKKSLRKSTGFSQYTNDGLMPLWLLGPRGIRSRQPTP